MARWQVILTILLAVSVLTFGPLPALAKTQITVWITDSYGQNMVEYFTGLVQKFEKSRTDIDVDLHIIPDGFQVMREKFVTAVAGNQAPTVVWSHVDHNWELESLGFFAPIPQQVLNDTGITSRFINYANVYVNDSGQYTRIPWSFQNGMLFYNKTLVANAGVAESSLSSSYDIFRTAIRKLTKVGADGIVSQAGFDQRREPEWLWMDLIYQQGAYMWTPDGKGDFANKASLAATDLLMDLMQFQPPYSSGSDKYGAFANGQSATIYAWGWVSNWLKNANPDMEFGVARMPTISGNLAPAYGRMNAEEGFMVYSKAPAEQQKAAWELAKYILADSDALIDIAIMTGGIPLDRKLWTDDRVRKNPVLATMAETLPYSVFPGEMGAATPDMVHKAWDAIANNRMAAPAAFEQANTEFNARASEHRHRIIERRYAF